MSDNATRSRCEIRPGIGLCDECGMAKWPQEYDGYGSMVCLDCLDKEKSETEAKIAAGFERVRLARSGKIDRYKSNKQEIRKPYKED